MNGCLVSAVKFAIEQQERWNRVFGTPEGRIVMREILTECHALNSAAPVTPESTALRNYALRMFSRATLTIDSEQDIVNAAFNKASQITPEVHEKHVKANMRREIED